MLKRDAFAIPPAPLAITVAGLMPFIGCAFAIVFLRGDVIRASNASLTLIAYSAVILSFLGGARWGAELMDAALSPPRWSVLALSVVGALAGWALVLYAILGSLRPELHLVFAALFLAHAAWDLRAPRLPAWYQGLRLIATTGAVMSLGAAYLVLGLT